jgi:hypothetical protein
MTKRKQSQLYKDRLMYLDVLKKVQQEEKRDVRDLYERKPLYWNPPQNSVNPFRSLWDEVVSLSRV